MKCTLCDSVLKNKIDEYFYDCHCCRAIVKDSAYYLSPDEEKARYETHNNDVDDIKYQNFTSPITNYVLEHFSHEQRGLDYGSGTGPVISKMLADRNYNVQQYDPFFNPDKELLKIEYDYIFSCEVFEHFYNPKTEIERLRKMLKKDGQLIFMTLLYFGQKDFKNWGYRNDPTHVFIFREDTVKYIAQKYSFNIEAMTDRLVCLKKV
ncbi:MAG: class I SAM-dependent methyltransferase [Bacteroidales bacterium]